jgi:hypothetical protein
VTRADPVVRALIATLIEDGGADDANRERLRSLLDGARSSVNGPPRISQNLP